MRSADGAEAVLEALDPEQREVATAPRGPVCVLAGAGTGKTRAVAHRIAYAGRRPGWPTPAHVLAVTFTTRAAGEFAAGWSARQRRSRRRAWSGPRPGPSTRRRCASSPTSGRPPWAARRRQVLDSKVSLLAEAARRLGCRAGWRNCGTSRRNRVGQGDPGPAGGLRRRPASKRAAPRRWPPMWWPGSTPGMRNCRRTATWWTSSPCWSSPRPSWPSIRQSAARGPGQVPLLRVDEYQDVNPLQKLLLDSWAGRPRRRLRGGGSRGRPSTRSPGPRPPT